MGCPVYIPASSDPGLGGGTGTITFEYVNKNIKSYPATFTYNPDKTINTITYDLGGGFSIVKTFAYSAKLLQTLTLSGDIPPGIDTVKTFTYSGKDLQSYSYS